MRQLEAIDQARHVDVGEQDANVRMLFEKEDCLVGSAASYAGKPTSSAMVAALMGTKQLTFDDVEPTASVVAAG
jgi:hypothetical protein